MEAQRASKKQQELLNFVATFISGHGYGPSYREIMRSLGYKSVSTVAVHIDGLIARGYLRKRDNSARSLEVVSVAYEEVQVAHQELDMHSRWLVKVIADRIKAYQRTGDPNKREDIMQLLRSMEILGFMTEAQALSAELETQ